MKKRLLPLLLSLALTVSSISTGYAMDFQSDEFSDGLFTAGESDSTLPAEDPISPQETASDEETSVEETELDLSEEAPDVDFEEASDNGLVQEPEDEELSSPFGAEEEILFEDEEAFAGNENNRSISAATMAGATSVSLSQTYSGSITASSPEKYYKFSLPSSGKLNISATAFVDKVFYNIYDPNGLRLISIEGTKNDTTGQISINQGHRLTSGTYYLGVLQNSGTGNYNFQLSLNSANETFKETNGGTNNSIATASRIGFGTTYYAQTALNDITDYYAFTIGQSGAVTITASVDFILTNGTNWDYLIQDGSGNTLYRLHRWQGFSAGIEKMEGTAYLTPGTYYIHVDDVNSKYLAYNFSLSFTPANESFPETNGGINNTLATASPISLGKKYNAQIAANDTKDFYKFTLPKACTLRLNATLENSLQAYKWFYIYDSFGNTLWSKWSYQNFTENIDMKAGTYYLGVVMDRDATGFYDFTLSEYTLDAPALRSIKNTSAGIELSWGSVSEADGYYVYRKTAGAVWSKIASITNAKTLSYLDTSAKAGTTYSYTVQAYNKTVAGSYHNTGISMKRLKQPVPSTSNASSGVKVTWKKITGASGYYVYRRTSSGSWKKLAAVSSKTLKYTDTKAGNGGNYLYTVVAYSGSYQSSSASGSRCIRMTSPTLSAPKNTASRKMTVKWKKNTKATGYQIQYSTSSSFKSYKSKTVTGKSNISKVITGLTKGKTYYVRVRSYKTYNGKKYFSTWSAKKKVKISK